MMGFCERHGAVETVMVDPVLVRRACIRCEAERTARAKALAMVQWDSSSENHGIVPRGLTRVGKSTAMPFPWPGGYDWAFDESLVSAQMSG